MFEKYLAEAKKIYDGGWRKHLLTAANSWWGSSQPMVPESSINSIQVGGMLKFTKNNKNKMKKSKNKMKKGKNKMKKGKNNKRRTKKN